MARLIWLVSEMGPLVWFAPAFLCLAYAAWRGGYNAAALGLGCLFTGAFVLMLSSYTGGVGERTFQFIWAQGLLLVVSTGAIRLILPMILSEEEPSSRRP